MLRQKSNLIVMIHQLLDAGITGVAFYLAYFTKINLPEGLGGLAQLHSHNLELFLAIISAHISLHLFGVYEPFRKQTFKQIVLRLFQASVTGVAGIVFLGYVLHLPSLSRIFLGLFGGYLFLLLTSFKYLLYRILTYNRFRDYNTRHILVIGSRHRALDFIKAVMRRPETGYRIVGCLEKNSQAETIGDRVYESVKVIGTLDKLKSLLEEQTIDEVVFGIPLKKIENVHEYIFLAEQMGINVRILPDFQINAIQYYPQTASVHLEQFMGLPTLSLFSTPTKDSELLVKAIIDYCGATLGVLLLSPFLLFIALLIKCTSTGPVFFLQERCGLNGRRFMVYKFRTMVANAEQLKAELEEANEMDGPVFKITNDPRITTIGKFLRKTSLDELPQLFNVLKGEMSLVGPRPPIPAEVEQYRIWQRRRLSMKPGITCIWQVSGRNAISFEQWMNMDLEYIDNWSLKLDFKLLMMTVREVTIGGGR